MEVINVLCFIGLIVSIVDGRSASEQVENEEHELQEVHLHVITKREALNDIQRDYPKVHGHTFRASEPLDPNKKQSAADETAPQNIFEGFDTVNTIFDPVVEEGGVHDTETGTERQYKPQSEVAAFGSNGQEASVDGNTDEDKEDEDDVGKKDENAPQNDNDPQYAAQRPYRLTSSTEDEYTRSSSYPTHTQSGYDEGTGLERRVTNRQVVVTGSGPGNDDQTRYATERRAQTHVTSNQYQPSQTRTYYPSQQQQYGESYNNGYERRTYSGSSGSETRGPAYNGPRYVDNNGHYIDAQGRHLDSTGRFYDISGRYSDARVTQTTTYSNSGTRYYPSPGGNQGRYNSRTQYVSGESAGDGQGGYNSRTQYVSGGSVPNQYVDPSQSRPVDSYGGTQFYSSGNSYQTNYSPVTSQISSDPNCPITNTRVTINGLTCIDAVSQMNYVCYNYERVSEECCQRCLQVKRSNQVGCEYGDRSLQCRSIQPHDCYSERNRQICCQRCEQIRTQMAGEASSGCEYGDMSPRCENVRLRPYLCYHSENARTCCRSCPRMANSQRSDCQWGDQNPMLCEPFDVNRRLQLNCYIPELRRLCCATCSSLRDRMRDSVSGCEYGDRPILYSNGRRQFDCSEYIREYGVNSCDNREFSQQCCYTCYRYRSRG